MGREVGGGGVVACIGRGEAGRSIRFGSFGDTVSVGMGLVAFAFPM